MPEDTEKTTNSTYQFDPAIQTEKIAFDAAELVPCGGCGRMNPPNRLKCLYCAHELEIRAGAGVVRPVLRKLELWERGFNLILRGTQPAADRTKAAEVLSADVSFIDEVLSAGLPLPLARVESEKGASILASTLTDIGFDCSVVADDELNADRLPVRLRSIQIADLTIGLTDFNTGEMTTIDIPQLMVAVPGRLMSGRIDASEKRGRKGKSKVLDEIETASDELVLDLYIRGDKIGYRVNQAGFDFSVLGPEKGFIAAENMHRLLILLKQSAPGLVVARQL